MHFKQSFVTRNQTVSIHILSNVCLYLVQQPTKKVVDKDMSDEKHHAQSEPSEETTSSETRLLKVLGMEY